MTDGIEWRQASFRGVPFMVEEHGRRSGRRGPTHSYPNQDEAAFEDLGLAPQRFTLKAHVIGADHHDQAKRLAEALDTKGVGELVHPRYGQLTVSVPEYEQTESIAERRMTRFSLTFVRSGNIEFPAATADTQAVVIQRRGTAEQATIEDFARVFSIDNQPNFVQDAGRNLVTDFLDQLDRGSLQADRMLSLNQVDGLLRQPTTLASRVLGLLSWRPTNPLQSFSGLSWRRPVDQGLSWNSYGSQYTPVLPTTISRQQQADNQIAFIELIRRGGLLDASSMSAEAVAPTRQEAIRLRDDVTVAFDETLPRASDQVYRPMAELRAATVRDLSVRSANVPELVSYQVNGPVPALVLAHRFYGDAADGGAGREAEILARNPRIRHPGFVPPGEIEVVTDA
ncbi:MAG: DNA circularization N-terminal domain-containing protein [Alphaproteobacteria bacterium]|nr:DNA circularization N-terminal domain-containing protein [Alphaproteobacteria bacterium]